MWCVQTCFNTHIQQEQWDTVKLNNNISGWKIVCEYCGLELVDQSTPNVHVKREHEQYVEAPNVSCRVCRKVFQSYNECHTHMATCYQYRCDDCKYESDGKEDISEHKNWKHTSQRTN